MNAWQIKQQQLVLVEQAMPEPEAEQIRVEVQAIGINRADILQIKGLYPAPAGFDSRVPGLEYAGVVEAVGSRVLDKKVGDKVMGLIPSGAYCQYVCVHEQESITIPDGLDVVQAATIPEAFLTAYRALVIEGQIQSGQFCLIRPATSAVGLAAVQLAKMLAAKPIGSSRHLANLANAKHLGLEHVAIEDDNWSEQIEQITQGQGLALIVDMLGSDWPLLLDTLNRGGRVVLLGLLAEQQSTLNLTRLLMQQQHIIGMTMRSQSVDKRIQQAQYFQQCLNPLFASGQLQALPLERFAFVQAQSALNHVQHNNFSGKRVLVLD